jgi:hypothetical protein
MDTLRSIPLTILCVLISATAWAAPPTYRVILVAAHTTFAAAIGLNNRGDVLGEVGEIGPEAFFFNYHSGARNSLTLGPRVFSVAGGISDSGLIVGEKRSSAPSGELKIPSTLRRSSPSHLGDRDPLYNRTLRPEPQTLQGAS